MMSYDILRVLRIFIPHNSLWIGIEDLGYWFYAGISTFLLLYRQNDGSLRAYAIVGPVAGMVIYDRLFSRFFLKGLQSVKNFITIKIKKKNKKPVSK